MSFRFRVIDLVATRSIKDSAGGPPAVKPSELEEFQPASTRSGSGLEITLILLEGTRGPVKRFGATHGESCDGSRVAVFGGGIHRLHLGVDFTEQSVTELINRSCARRSPERRSLGGITTPSMFQQVGFDQGIGGAT